MSTVMNADIKKAERAAAAAAALHPTGSGGTIQKLMQSMAASIGWTGQMWDALYNVEMREAGFNMRAQNPSSGAYGLAQFINGPSEYYQYGGNPNTAQGQIIAMFNYIKSRYGNPIAAYNHEQAVGWYDQGGMLPTGLSLALNTTGAPEPVGGGGGNAVHHVHVYLDGKQIWSAVQQENLKYNVRNSGAQQSGVLAPSFGKTIFHKGNP